MPHQARLAICVLVSAAVHAALLGLLGARAPQPEGFFVLALRDSVEAKLLMDSLQHSALEAPPPVFSAAHPTHSAQQPVPSDRPEETELAAEKEPRRFFILDEVDSPPELLSEFEFESKVGPDTAGFVIDFRIEVLASGRAHRVEIINNWLDEQTTEALLAKLGAARYKPAQRLGLPVNGVLEGGFGLEPEKNGPANAGPGKSMSPQR